MNLSNKDIIIFTLLIISLYMNYCNMKEPFTVNLKKDAKGNFVIPGNLKVNAYWSSGYDGDADFFIQKKR